MIILDYSAEPNNPFNVQQDAVTEKIPMFKFLIKGYRCMHNTDHYMVTLLHEHTPPFHPLLKIAVHTEYRRPLNFSKGISQHQILPNVSCGNCAKTVADLINSLLETQSSSSACSSSPEDTHKHTI